MAQEVDIGGRPPKFDNADDLQKKVDEYFVWAKEQNNGLKTITGLALFLGFESRQSIYDYEKDGTFSYIIKNARLRVEEGYEERLHGAMPTGAIFALKNMGWKDKVETGFTDGEGKDVKPQIIFNAAPNCKPIEEDPGNVNG